MPFLLPYGCCVFHIGYVFRSGYVLPGDVLHHGGHHRGACLLLRGVLPRGVSLQIYVAPRYAYLLRGEARLRDDVHPGGEVLRRGGVLPHGAVLRRVAGRRDHDGLRRAFHAPWCCWDRFAEDPGEYYASHPVVCRSGGCPACRRDCGPCRGE